MKFSLTNSATAALLLLGSSSGVSAAPMPTTPPTDDHLVAARSAGKTAADLIAAVAPASTSCSSASSQCRTAAQAAPYFIEAFAKYKLLAPGQIAAVLALTAYESGDYVYKVHLGDSNPGQGTSNMQSPEYNYKYAQSIPALSAKVAAVGGDSTTEQKMAILSLVDADEYNFGSGAWFLATQCPQATVDAVAKGDDAGFDAYMECVGTSTTPDRLAYWTRAKAAFGLS
ncbi:hypothetical protein GGR56DRAFT_62317 [Xylariaceae sp. FL0804]|nr:hypothetical protein GGR56DRAFT_62317 [Xylariaceae sp. FL0804]